MRNSKQTSPPPPFESTGERVNRKIEEAARRVEEESARLITYINDQLVPDVRKHSSRGLREASRKLAEFAEYLERNQHSGK